MRLIDADQMALDESDAYMAAQAQISDDALWRTNAVVHIKIQQLIADTPTVDAAPVVRCKDCKHSYITVDARCCSYGAFYDVAVPDDFFCALAKRKGGDDNAAD